MIHDVARLVAHVSAAFTLLPGDVLLTGTPAGVGPVEAGQRVQVPKRGGRSGQSGARQRLGPHVGAAHHGRVERRRG